MWSTLAPQAIILPVYKELVQSLFLPPSLSHPPFPVSLLPSSPVKLHSPPINATHGPLGSHCAGVMFLCLVVTLHRTGTAPLQTMPARLPSTWRTMIVKLQWGCSTPHPTAAACLTESVWWSRESGERRTAGQVVHYIGNRVPFGTHLHSTVWPQSFFNTFNTNIIHDTERIIKRV